MKRIFGFLLGAGLGVLIAYSLRRFLARNTVTPAPIEIPVPTNNNVAEPFSNEKVTTKFTVRRTGPRPQSPLNEGDSAAADGQPTTADSKKEVEQILQEVKPTIQPVAEPEPVEETLVDNSTTDSNNDDFTVLDDIGPVFNTKLHNAGVHTFAELAALSSEDIAEKVGTNAARVERFLWREQAARLASGSSDTPAEETKAEG
jgi:predicted flap endonuclease-1-like 5' DNA nuclease